MCDRRKPNGTVGLSPTGGDCAERSAHVRKFCCPRPDAALRKEIALYTALTTEVAAIQTKPAYTG